MSAGAPHHNHLRDVQDRLERHMEEHRGGDIAKAVVITATLAAICGYWLGLERASFLGYSYATGGWSPLWGLAGAVIPLLAAPRLYRWMRARRARRFYTG